MPRPLSRSLRAWFGWLMAALLCGSLAVWWATSETLPGEIVIGTAVRGGLYDAEGRAIAEAITASGVTRASVRETEGSADTAARLRDGAIDAGIMQLGAVPLDGLAIVTPLHRDVVHVLVASGLVEDGSVRGVGDLAGRRVLVGLPGSGMVRTADDVLAHYGLTGRVDAVPRHFTDLLGPDADCDAAIVTTGVENADLARVLATGRYALLPLDADAIAMTRRHFESYVIPRGLWHPRPAADVPTVAVAAVVVVRADAPGDLVRALLAAVFEGRLGDRLGTVFARDRAREFAVGRLHPVTRQYYDPFGQYGLLHTVLEGLVAGKELLFAVGAGVYLLWDRWRRLRERETAAAVQAQKDRLDVYLERTLLIEREQMDVADPARLQAMLDEVTNIKLEALDRLTHEELRGDGTFSIFLTQCANLISKIQLKILEQSRKDL
ncbi:MAG: TAXI family TRAP transporter solute-binding subunit [Planctomycetota bacterium]